MYAWREKLSHQDNCVTIGLNNRFLGKGKMTQAEDILL